MRTDSLARIPHHSRRPLARRFGMRLCLRHGFYVSAILITIAGCKHSDRSPVSGTVTVNGVKPESGRVFLMPIEGTKGPRAIAQINNGEYEFSSDGGIPSGKYRVELEALKKTGRKIKAPLVGGEMAEKDETEQLAPPEYRDENSPLAIDVPGQNGGKIDIVVPIN